MSKTFLWLIAAIILSVCSAQPSGAQVNPNAQRPTRTQVREEPCWQKVGITKEVKEQRDAIALDTRSQVQAVCADTSLAPQQKKQKIQQIHQESKQKVGGLISEQQQEELQACQKERAASHPSSAGTQHGGGPCGEMTSPSAHTAGAPQAPGAESR
jgi:hypothetical protein